VALYALLVMLKSQKISIMPLALVAINIVAAGLNLLAPSTFARQKLQTHKAEVFDITSLKQIEELLAYFGSLPGVFLIALSVHLAYSRVNDKKSDNQGLVKSWEMWLPVFAFSTAVFLSVLLPIFLSMLSGPIPDRTKNPLLFLSGLMVFVLAGFGAKKLQNSRWGFWRLIIATVFFVLGLLSIPNIYLNRAMQHVTSGNAFASVKLDKERFLQIESCQSDTCIISVNPYYQKGLTASENAILDSDPPSWKRYKDFSFATYFGKKSIIARP
jgi:hypothetical protein